MLRPQKISERLENILFFTRSRPKNNPVRVWQFFHGSKFLGALSIATSVTSFGSSLCYGTDLMELEILFFFCSALFTYGESIDFWNSRRRRLESVTVGLIAVAKSIESLSSKKILLKMERTTHLCRLLVMVYSIDCILILLLFMIYPLQHGKLAADIPYLSHDKHIYYVLLCLEELLLAVGAVTYFSLLSYYIEVSVLLSCLYKILSANFEEGRVCCCIRIHQSLVEVSKMFQGLFSRSLSMFSGCFSALMVGLTCIVLLSEYPEPMFIVALGTCFLAYYAVCYFSEHVAVSYEAVATAVYRSKWVDSNAQIRMDLSLVILMSQKNLYWKAGIFGELKRSQYITVLNRWYQTVQAILNLSK